MSHALDMSAGKAAIAYRGELPWHGMGQQITDGMTLAQMRKAAQLNWSVLELDSFYPMPGKVTKQNPNPEPTMLKVPNRKALVRSDNGAFLSHMSENKYEVRQPADIVEFFRDICEAGGFQIETLGALNDGRRVWCMAERKGGSEELSGLIKPKILLAESYDGTMATVAKFTSVTVVCANTLAMARADGKKQEIKVGHHQKFDPAKVKQQLAGFDESFATFLDTMKKFTEVKMSKEFRERFFLKLFGGVNGDAKKADKHFFGETAGKGATWKRAKIDYDALSTASYNTVKRLLEFSEAGNAPGSDFFTGSLYNALQTVTYFQDHEARTWGDGAKRWESASLGNGAAMKDEAFALASSLVD